MLEDHILISLCSTARRDAARNNMEMGEVCPSRPDLDVLITCLSTIVLLVL